MKYDPYIPLPPPDIIQAATKVQRWAESQCVRMGAHWAVAGVQKRDSEVELLVALKGLIQECEYSASSGLPFNTPEGKGNWTQLQNAKDLLVYLRL